MKALQYSQHHTALGDRRTEGPSKAPHWPQSDSHASQHITAHHRKLSFGDYNWEHFKIQYFLQWYSEVANSTIYPVACCFKKRESVVDNIKWSFTSCINHIELQGKLGASWKVLMALQWKESGMWDLGEEFQLKESQEDLWNEMDTCITF